eukprot:CAMPEP_0182420644 /NCGR_PEP_ID=MMETSP1167-20130531/5596_1 /TAXON_ID=2988 /ORGANISM="Mallomonas Sp, Strain CCMP3275" /LENGTH=186 /DNA_ID=CAMNT_0024596871 /DNA_START=56 /DNA_END=616 /DNA_ORIENTATION=-
MSSSPDTPEILPASQSSSTSTPLVRCVSSRSDKFRRRVRRILVVDDVPMNRKMLCRLLEDYCDILDTAEDGVEAVQMIHRTIETPTQTQTQTPGQPVDLVLMDYQMPRMDGPTAAHAMRQMGFQAPIIGVTGNVLASHVQAFLSGGANAVLPKPLDFDLLKDIMIGLGMDTRRRDTLQINGPITSL